LIYNIIFSRFASSREICFGDYCKVDSLASGQLVQPQWLRGASGDQERRLTAGIMGARPPVFRTGDFGCLLP
jgi:hypothetical protein